MSYLSTGKPRSMTKPRPSSPPASQKKTARTRNSSEAIRTMDVMPERKALTARPVRIREVSEDDRVR